MVSSMGVLCGPIKCIANLIATCLKLVMLFLKRCYCLSLYALVFKGVEKTTFTLGTQSTHAQKLKIYSHTCMLLNHD